jgi:hypothetical protein
VRNQQGRGNPRLVSTRRIAAWLRTIRTIRDRYAEAHGRRPMLFWPRRYTEKMQWRKLFDRNPLFTVFCDKLATRGLIAARIGAEYLAPLVWTGGAEEIPFDQLAPPYFLKSTHASGQVLSVTAALPPDAAAIQARAADWLQTCFSSQQGEPGYKDVPRRLIAEQALLTADGGPPEERRLFVFDGKVAVINTVFVEDGRVRNGAFHTPDWERLDWHFTRFVAAQFPRPRRLAEMIRIAEQLGQGIDHVRVDFYDCGDRIYAGELTVYSWSGLARFNSDAVDLALGRFWRLRWPLSRAVAAILFRDRP